jgi:SHS2 domain-containing protein
MTYVNAQELKPVPNNAFIRGEQLKYRAYYDSKITGKVTAGIATLEVKFENTKVNDRNTYHIIGEGKSKGAFNLFYKVVDRFESYMDEEYLVPWSFIRKTREADYKKDDEVRFNQYSGSYSSRTANKNMKPGTHDILSAFYYCRTLDFSDIRIGDRFPVDFMLDDSVYTSFIEFAGREDVITDLGRFHCLKFKPMVATGNVFSQPYPMDIWISDDENRIPILAKSAVVVGSVKLELIEYKGLANPLTSLVKE